MSLVDVAELHEAVPSGVHPEPGLDVAADERARSILLTIEGDERPHPSDEPGRTERPAATAGSLAIAHLRHEAGIRAKAVAEILVECEGVEVRRIVLPQQARGVRGERLTGPLVRQIRPVRRAGLAVQRLPGHDVGA
jgi:hypothetical protein